MAKDRTESKYISVAADVELHYLDRGAGQPILFIPGLTFAGEIFAAQVEHFSQTHRVIAIDPRGQGLSTKTPHGNDYLTHGRDLSALIEALDLQDLVLVGWSTGNLDVWAYLSQYGSARLKAAVTVDMSPLPLSPDPQGWVEATIEEIRMVATQVLTSAEGTRAFFSDYATGVMVQRPMEPGELEYLLDMSAKTPYYICQALFNNAVLSDFFDVVRQTSETLPSLMFIAEHWSETARPFMAKNFPAVKTHVMGGHLMFYEYPGQWNKVLEDFLAGIK